MLETPAGWTGDISIAVTRDAMCPKGRATVTLGLADGTSRTHAIEARVVEAMIANAILCIYTSELARTVAVMTGGGK